MALPTRIIVCGSRHWHDVEELKVQVLLALKEFIGRIVIVHGHCPTGADHMADELAIELQPRVTSERHPADWDTYGAGAGPRRNAQMASSGAEVCLAFWDGRSKGTLSMIREATKQQIPVRIYPQ